MSTQSPMSSWPTPPTARARRPCLAATIAVHLYGESTARFEIDGIPVSLTQETDYPWGGIVDISVRPEKAARFDVALRVPAWAEGASVLLNGVPTEVSIIDGYAHMDREWQPGDRVALDLPMSPRAVRAHINVRQDAGRLALMRGPLVYCLEGADNTFRLNSVVVRDGLARARTAAIPDLNGAIAIDLPVLREVARSEALYSTEEPNVVEDTARLVPYHLWDNRSPGEMLVWLRSGRG